MKIALVILAAFGVGLGAWRLTFGSDKLRIQRCLNCAQLGPLPKSATNLRYQEWIGIFTGETYAKFQLSPADLSKFIARASTLRDWKAESFTPNHQLRPSLELDLAKPDVSSHEYIPSGARFPEWFDMTIRQKGHRYTRRLGSLAWIVINEQDNTVFIWLVKG